MTPRGITALLSVASGKATVAAYRTAWRAVRLAPEAVAYGVGDLVADLMWRRGGKGVVRMRANYARVRPDLAESDLDALVRAGLRSYLRYAIDSFRLPDRTADELRATVRTRNDGAVRDYLQSGRAVVVFVGHMGNWDVAGAWSTQNLAPVTTVAERLKPEEVFREFFAFRERLGMTILPLTGGDDPFAGLVAAVERGDFVALAADRDLTRGGVEVEFFGRRARMAKGPAALALRTGAALFAAEIHFEKAPRGEGLGGYYTVVGFSDEIRPPVVGDTSDAAALDTVGAVQAMTQACATHLEGAIREHTEDWHMMQKVFIEDLDPARDAAR